MKELRPGSSGRSELRVLLSKIEHGDLDSAKVGTIRGYLEAVGGGLALEFVVGDARIQIA